MADKDLLLTGSGDASDNKKKPEPKKKYNYSNHTHTTPINKTVQRQLEREATKLKTLPKKPPIPQQIPFKYLPLRKRSLTMSELLSPAGATKRKINRTPRKKSESNTPRSDTGELVNDEFLDGLRRKELLLRGFGAFNNNLICRQRQHLNRLKEKVSECQEQISQLILQTKLLQDLHENEYARHSVTQDLMKDYKFEIENLIKEFDQTQEKCNEYEMQLEISRNDFFNMHTEHKREIFHEHEQVVALEAEQEILLIEINNLKDETTGHHNTIEELQHSIKDLKEQLQTSVLLNEESAKKVLELKRLNEVLELKLMKNEEKEKELKLKMVEVHQNLCKVENINSYLKIDNKYLKEMLRTTENELNLLKNRKWTQITYDAMKVSMKFLLNVATIMLPALPPSPTF